MKVIIICNIFIRNRQVNCAALELAVKVIALIFQVSEFSFNYSSLKAGVQYPWHRVPLTWPNWQSYPAMSGDKEHGSATSLPWCTRMIIPPQPASRGCRHSCSCVHMGRRMKCWQLHGGVSLSDTGIKRRGAIFCQGTRLAGKWKSFLKITRQPPTSSATFLAVMESAPCRCSLDSHPVKKLQQSFSWTYSRVFTTFTSAIKDPFTKKYKLNHITSQSCGSILVLKELPLLLASQPQKHRTQLPSKSHFWGDSKHSRWGSPAANCDATELVKHTNKLEPAAGLVYNYFILNWCSRQTLGSKWPLYLHWLKLAGHQVTHGLSLQQGALVTCWDQLIFSWPCPHLCIALRA